MAKNDMVKVKALVNIKYDRAVKSAGTDLSIRPEDVEEMVEKGLIEAPKDFTASVDATGDGKGNK